ncbi:MAG: hypothetical protein IKV51_02780 [Clostridia bacterium]|nr:hypothetical protein [Clostridia bacterium]
MAEKAQKDQNKTAGEKSIQYPYRRYNQKTSDKSIQSGKDKSGDIRKNTFRRPREHRQTRQERSRRQTGNGRKTDFINFPACVCPNRKSAAEKQAEEACGQHVQP